MAGRNDTFMKEEERIALVEELRGKGELTTGNIPYALRDAVRKAAVVEQHIFGTGCLSCGEDDDHANLLLCEICNDEYHTYCLDPPLRSVPTGDFFCIRCKETSIKNNDGLDELVSATSPEYTSRFGEVCWAQGGVGFGWWPSVIYDPRLSAGNARDLAKKHLGKRHLVFFLECHDAPFAVLTKSKIQKWEDGLIEDLHLGKTAKVAGKARFEKFRQALQAALLEAGKPIEMRMNPEPEEIPSPQMTSPKRLMAKKRRKRVREEGVAVELDLSRASKSRGFQFLKASDSSLPQPQTPTTTNLNAVINSIVPKNEMLGHIENDQELFCRIIFVDRSKTPEARTEYGFVKLASKETCTFADVRSIIEEELMSDSVQFSWKFLLPTLGQVSNKQETTLGPVFPILKRTFSDTKAANGSLDQPFEILIMKCP